MGCRLLMILRGSSASCVGLAIWAKKTSEFCHSWHFGKLLWKIKSKGLVEPLAHNTTNQQNIFPYMYENTLVHFDIIFAIGKFEKDTFLVYRKLFLLTMKKISGKYRLWWFNRQKFHPIIKYHIAWYRRTSPSHPCKRKSDHLPVRKKSSSEDDLM